MALHEGAAAAFRLVERGERVHRRRRSRGRWPRIRRRRERLTDVLVRRGRSGADRRRAAAAGDAGVGGRDPAAHGRAARPAGEVRLDRRRLAARAREADPQRRGAVAPHRRQGSACCERDPSSVNRAGAAGSHSASHPAPAAAPSPAPVAAAPPARRADLHRRLHEGRAAHGEDPRGRARAEVEEAGEDVGRRRRAEPRTILAGIAESYEPEALVGRTIVIVANLKPAKLMGIESNGMVLAASPDGGRAMLVNPEPAPPGTRVRYGMPTATRARRDRLATATSPARSSPPICDAVVARARRPASIALPRHSRRRGRRRVGRVARRWPQAWPEVRFAVGVHPHQAHSLRRRPGGGRRGGRRPGSTASPLACAVGEIGLDYHYDFSPRDVQQAVFRAQLALAQARRLPVVIHTREAEDDTLRIIAEGRPRGPLRGVFHCFTGGPRGRGRAHWRPASTCLVPGIVTFPQRRELREPLRAVPLDRLLIETDSPYLAPVPYRGKRNEPAYGRRRTAGGRGPRARGLHGRRRWRAASCATTTTGCSPPRGPQSSAATRIKRAVAALTLPARYGEIDELGPTRVEDPTLDLLQMFEPVRADLERGRARVRAAGRSRRSGSSPRSAPTSRRAAASASARRCC